MATKYPRALIRRRRRLWKIHLLQTPVEKPGADNLVGEIQHLSGLGYKLVNDLVAEARQTPETSEPPC